MKEKSVIQGVLLWDDLNKPKFYLRYVDDILAALWDDLNKTKFYLRYVDDILAAFDKEQDS